MQKEIENLNKLKISNNFFHINQDKSEDKINSLIDKYIIFEEHDHTNNTICVLPGKLLNYKDGVLLIRKNDDGSEETMKNWTCNEETLFTNFEEKININNIRGIEELVKINPDLEFKDEYINNICKLTNKNDESIVIIIKGYDGFEILFDYKCEEDDMITGESTYPLCLLKKIEVIK